MPKKKTRLTIEEFIKRAKEVHGEKYDYSKSEYVNADTKVSIICPIHGEFLQTPYKHTRCKQGCPRCAKEVYDTASFVEKAKKVHGDKYDYSKVEYINNSTKVCIICPKHGEFWQRPSNHLSGLGCQQCFEEKRKRLYNLTKEEFIEKAKKVHGDKYDYSKVEYVNNRTKVCIICKEHGEFLQTPTHHLEGNSCPKCKSSKLENEIRDFLIEKNILFEEQKRFLQGNRMTLDFYIPSLNVAIECQGIQHFKPVDFSGKGEEWAAALFQGTLERDERKRKLCEENSIKLLYYSDLGIDYPYKVFEDKEELLKEIMNKNG